MLPEAPARVAHTASIPTIQARVEEQMNAGLLVQSDQLVAKAGALAEIAQVGTPVPGPKTFADTVPYGAQSTPAFEQSLPADVKEGIGAPILQKTWTLRLLAAPPPVPKLIPAYSMDEQREKMADEATAAQRFRDVDFGPCIHPEEEGMFEVVTKWGNFGIPQAFLPTAPERALPCDGANPGPSDSTCPEGTLLAVSGDQQVCARGLRPWVILERML